MLLRNLIPRAATVQISSSEGAEMSDPVQMKRRMHRRVFDDAGAVGKRELKLLQAIDRARPCGIRMSRLMFIIDLPVKSGHYGIEPHSHFVQFACALATVGNLIRHHGWELHRSGGRYTDEVWISEQRVSS